MSDNNSNNVNELNNLKKSKEADISVKDTSVASDSAENKTSSTKQKKKLSHDIIEYIELVVATFSVIVILFSLVFRLCTVDGDSMNNTLEDKDVVVCSNVFYTPKREDIIVFHQTGTENKPIVKRVIGVPGDTISIEYYPQTMRVTVTDKDGYIKILEEDYIKYDYQRYYGSVTYDVVKEGTVFVMGDNRNNSLDSRFESIGFVDTRRILGKVSVRIAPFNKFGSVN